jgi:hypothetical protein
MEAICSSETSVNTQRTTRRYIPEVGTLQQKELFCFRFHLKVDPKSKQNVEHAMFREFRQDDRFHVCYGLTF